MLNGNIGFSKEIAEQQTQAADPKVWVRAPADLTSLAMQTTSYWLSLRGVMVLRCSTLAFRVISMTVMIIAGKRCKQSAGCNPAAQLPFCTTEVLPAAKRHAEWHCSLPPA